MQGLRQQLAEPLVKVAMLELCVPQPRLKMQLPCLTFSQLGSHMVQIGFLFV